MGGVAVGLLLAAAFVLTGDVGFLPELPQTLEPTWLGTQFTRPKDLASHAAGAALMGFGGVTALGCSMGNGVTGLALLSVGSGVAVAGIVVGACVALKVEGRTESASAGNTPVLPG